MPSSRVPVAAHPSQDHPPPARCWLACCMAACGTGPPQQPAPLNSPLNLNLHHLHAQPLLRQLQRPTPQQHVTTHNVPQPTCTSSCMRSRCSRCASSPPSAPAGPAAEGPLISRVRRALRSCHAHRLPFTPLTCANRAAPRHPASACMQPRPTLATAAQTQLHGPDGKINAHQSHPPPSCLHRPHQDPPAARPHPLQGRITKSQGGRKVCEWSAAQPLQLPAPGLCRARGAHAVRGAPGQ